MRQSHDVDRRSKSLSPIIEDSQDILMPGDNDPIVQWSSTPLEDSLDPIDITQPAPEPYIC